MERSRPTPRAPAACKHLRAAPTSCESRARFPSLPRPPFPVPHLFWADLLWQRASVPLSLCFSRGGEAGGKSARSPTVLPESLPLRSRSRRLSQGCIPGVKKLKSRIRRGAEKAGGGGLSGDSPRGGREKRRLKPLRVERVSLRAEPCVTFWQTSEGYFSRGRKTQSLERCGRPRGNLRLGL